MEIVTVRKDEESGVVANEMVHPGGWAGNGKLSSALALALAHLGCMHA